MTPYPSSTMESSTWNPLAKSALLGIDMAPYVFSNAAFHHASAPNRPRSSPSSFGPAPDSIQWPTPNALGIHFQPEVAAAPATVPATSHGFEPRPSRHQFSVSSTPELRQPRPLRPYHSIAPSPAGTSTTAPATKRRMTDDDEAFLGAEVSSRVGTPKRRKRASSVNSTDLSEDDRFLVQLKEDESLPWKEIAARFIADKGKTLQVAALQMRYKRLRERSRAWEDRDLNALRLAHEYWEECKWDIISQKVSPSSSTHRLSSSIHGPPSSLLLSALVCSRSAVVYSPPFGRQSPCFVTIAR